MGNVNILNRSLRWYTESLHRIITSPNVLFRCPICLQDINNENQFVQDIAEAHIIPKALGGKSKTYVCRNCDNKIGHTCEGPFINWARDLRIIYGKNEGRLRGKFEYIHNNIKLQTHLNFKSNRGWSLLVPKPGCVHHFVNDIPPDGIIRKPQKFNFIYSSRNRINDAIAQISMLKIAYLGAFEMLGYEYILNEQLNWVRTILQTCKIDNTIYKFAFILPKGLARTEFNEQLPLIVIFEGSLNSIPALVCMGRFYEAWYLIALPPLNRRIPNDYNGYFSHESVNFDTTLEIEKAYKPIL
jgi:hypothetical protein